VATEPARHGRSPDRAALFAARIDCNRPFDSPGSIPLISEATEIPGKALTHDQIAARRQAIFTPYHARIAQALDVRKAAGSPPS